MMARLQPRFVLCLHDMTVGAGRGIIRQVGIPFGVDKGVGAKADYHSEKNRHRDNHCRGSLHRKFQSKTLQAYINLANSTSVNRESALLQAGMGCCCSLPSADRKSVV